MVPIYPGSLNTCPFPRKIFYLQVTHIINCSYNKGLLVDEGRFISVEKNEWNHSFYYTSFSALTFLWPLLPQFYKLDRYCPKSLNCPFNRSCFTIQPVQHSHQIQFVNIPGALRGQMTICLEIHYKIFYFL